MTGAVTIRNVLKIKKVVRTGFIKCSIKFPKGSERLARKISSGNSTGLVMFVKFFNDLSIWKRLSFEIE